MLTNVNQKWQKMLTFVNFGGFLLTLLTCHLCGNVTQNVNFWGFLKKKNVQGAGIEPTTSSLVAIIFKWATL